MLCRAQKAGLLDLAPIDLPDVGPRLIATGSQELLQGERVPPLNLAGHTAVTRFRLLTCRTSTIGTPLQSNLGIFAPQLGGSNVSDEVPLAINHDAHPRIKVASPNGCLRFPVTFTLPNESSPAFSAKPHSLSRAACLISV